MAAILLIAFGLSGGAAQAVNITNNYTGSATGSVLSGGNWNLGHVPIVSEDAVFTATTGIRTMTAGNLTVGSWNVTAASGTFSLRNDTATATDSILTLGGAGNLGNGVSGTTGDLLYAASGSTFNILGPNGGGGSGVLKLALGQSGNFNIAGTSTISAAISGTGFGFTKAGAGTLTLSVANTYSGGTTLSAGQLTITNNSALGGGALTLSGGTFFGSGTTAVPNAVVATASTNTSIYGGGAASFLRLNGNITGTGTLTVISTNGGNVRLGGDNSGFTGQMTINPSAAMYLFATTAGSASATWQVNGSLIGLTPGTFNLGALSGGGVLQSQSGAQTYSIGALNTNTTFSGSILNFGGNIPSIRKVGNGILTLTGGASNYSGATNIDAGTLRVSNTTGSGTGAGAVNVNNGGTLGGTGSLSGPVTVISGGRIAPGASTESLAIGSLTMASGSTLAIELGGLTAGAVASGYDQLQVTGTVNLGGATLTLSQIGGYSPTSGDTFFILTNDLSDAVTGVFNGLLNDAVFLYSHWAWRIRYNVDAGTQNFNLGSGNDVAVQALFAVPEPSTWLLSSLGACLLVGAALRSRKSRSESK